MSHFTIIRTRITDEDALVEALERLGFPVERHTTAQRLYGYRGDKRKDKAHVIIRRQHLGASSNDIGFRKEEDGTFTAIISEFDRAGRFNEGWLGKVTQRYAYNVLRPQLKAGGWTPVEQVIQPDQKIRLVMRRAV